MGIILVYLGLKLDDVYSEINGRSIKTPFISKYSFHCKYQNLFV